MDLALLVILLVIVIAVFRDVKLMVYLVGILEIFFRVFHYIGDHLGVYELNLLIDNYLPDSIFSIFAKYTSGVIYDVLSWTLVICFLMFLFYLIKYFFSRR